jgi:D-alanyl-D-alanine carboxypeptidase/D-alanyl-D-alanine-endopeptidase (penicillin-binding protein 4)
VAALSAALIAAPAGAGSASGLPTSTAVAPGATPDIAVRTPVARPRSVTAAGGGLSRDQLRDGLRSAARSAGGSAGVFVFDTGGDGKLFGRKASKRRILASNEKLFTTAAALEKFGPDHRFETAVYGRGKRTGADARVLRGDLILAGDGDPALGTTGFARRHGLPLTPIGELARGIAASGIRRVKGKVRADDSIFDRKRGIPSTGFRSSRYLSPLSGLSFNSGFGSGDYARAPELQAARALKRALKKRGVRVRGVGRAKGKRKNLSNREPLGTVASPSLATLAEETNEPSNNFFAEMLLKRLGAAGSKRGTTKRGAKRARRFAKRIGSGVRASDGSGLGRKNRASPKQVGKLLVGMTRSSVASRDAFRESLAVAGREGTLSGRMRGTAAAGRCEGKTGTLRGVSALSGYCQVGGAPIVFSVLVNRVRDVSAARRSEDRIAAAVARYER